MKGEQLFAVAAVLAIVLIGFSPAHVQSAAATYKAKCAGCHAQMGREILAQGRRSEYMILVRNK